ncbi:MAG: PLP-dependent aminotransferase family protein [Solirubrobacteraceae bacterium]
MSYKLDLSHINRERASSLNEQLVSVVRSAIENGELAGGDRLPTTRALAEQTGVNHLTAVRAYRRLAELGYVTASVGRGTFVRAVPPPAVAAGGRWQHAILPDAPGSYVNQVIADTWQAPDARDTVNFATGWASSELHPVDELRRLADLVFAEEGATALMYGDPDGLWPLREELARRGVADGFALDAEDILVTSGARQAIDLVCRAILKPGDVAVSESPTFMGALASLQNTGARVLGVPYGREGFDVEALESILARHEVKLVVVQTASQNPTGQDLAPDQAERLLELARERSFFILEDGVYATVRFHGMAPQRLRVRAPEHVVYVDSLSKTIGGGLRVGWLAATGELRRRLTGMKLASDYHTAILVQHLAHRWLISGLHEHHIRRVNPIYSARASALLDALERRLGDELRPLRPRGGHHVWAEFARPLDERMLAAEALRNGVSFTPGGATRPEPGGSGGLRLSFSLLDENVIDEGVRRLAVALRAVRRSRTGAGAVMS